jgi:hypothetical protein
MARLTLPSADDIFHELKGENDRAVISVGGSFVEYGLEEAILSRLRQPQTPAEHDVLFNDRGIIGTFSEKIWAAYFLKIIGPTTRRDIDLIRKIRNIAAHEMRPVSFENTPEISSRCRELVFARETVPGQSTPQDVRGMFVGTVQFYTANLLARSGDDQAEILEAFKGLAPYLDR